VKQAHAFSGARPLARHHAALLRAGPGPDELLPALARAGERMARLLRASLAPMMGGKSPLVRAAPPAITTCAALAADIAPLAANALLVSGAQDAPLLLSIDAGAVFALVDRAFGGDGCAPDPLPGEFPVSSELMAARVEGAVSAALAASLGAGTDAIRPLRRDGSLAQLAPFPADLALARMELAVEETDRAPWTMILALPLPTLAGLFGHGDRPPAPRRIVRTPDPEAAPFRDLPLPLRAVMAEMDLPVATVSALRVGQVLPVAVARIVPLRIGSRTIAHGSVGAVDDRVAVQITRLS
jgi:flagellar motor switch protein FliM